MKAKVEQAEAEAAAMAELRGMEPGGAAEDIEAPDEDLDVATELAEMKKKMRK
jgi:phage shock protein A